MIEQSDLSAARGVGTEQDVPPAGAVAVYYHAVFRQRLEAQLAVLGSGIARLLDDVPVKARVFLRLVGVNPVDRISKPSNHAELAQQLFVVRGELHPHRLLK